MKTWLTRVMLGMLLASSMQVVAAPKQPNVPADAPKPVPPAAAPEASPTPAAPATPAASPTPPSQPIIPSEEPQATAPPAPPEAPPLIFVSDRENHRVLRLSDMKGGKYESFGDPGHGPGRLLNPSQIWVDHKKRVYIADTGNDRIIRIDEMTGRGYAEMNGFKAPEGVAVNGNELFVADTGNNRVVVYTDMGGTLLRTYEDARLKHPTSIWFDEAGDCYVTCGDDPLAGRLIKLVDQADKSGKKWQVYEGEGLKATGFAPSQVVTQKGSYWMIDPSSNRLVRTENLQGKSAREYSGKGSAQRFSNPRGLAVDKKGNIYVADTGNDRVVQVDGTDPRNWLVWNGSFADRNSVALRSPVSVFVWCPAPPPKPPEDEDDPKHPGKKKKKKPAPPT